MKKEWLIGLSALGVIVLATAYNKSATTGSVLSEELKQGYQFLPESIRFPLLWIVGGILFLIIIISVLAKE